MGATGEQAQHADGIRVVDRLVENFVIADDDRVGTEDEQRIVCRPMGGSGKNCFSFFAGETLYQVDGIFIGTGVFIDRDRFDLEGKASLGEQFATARRCGGKDEHGLPTTISS